MFENLIEMGLIPWLYDAIIHIYLLQFRGRILENFCKQDGVNRNEVKNLYIIIFN